MWKKCSKQSGQALTPSPPLTGNGKHTYQKGSSLMKATNNNSIIFSYLLTQGAAEGPFQGQGAGEGVRGRWEWELNKVLPCRLVDKKIPSEIQAAPRYKLLVSTVNTVFTPFTVHTVYTGLRVVRSKQTHNKATEALLIEITNFWRSKTGKLVLWDNKRQVHKRTKHTNQVDESLQENSW